MQLNLEVRQPAIQPAGSTEPSQPWFLGRLHVLDGPRATPAGRPYSFLAECECPGDCLRDHENE